MYAIISARMVPPDSLLGGGAFQGLPQDSEKRPSFEFGKTGGAYGAFIRQKHTKTDGLVWRRLAWVFLGRALAFGLDVDLRRGRKAGVTRDWCQVVFRTFWGISAGGGGGRDP